jgi:hypothetical protein
MNAKGVVVGSAVAVAVMLSRENIVAGRSSGEIQWNGQSRLLMLNNRTCSGIGNGLVFIPILSEARNASVTHSRVGEDSTRIWRCFWSRERSQPSTGAIREILDHVVRVHPATCSGSL